jgi:competence protein ComEC
VNTLALAALVILIVDPPSLFSISFQLSFVTVFTIIYGFAAIQNVSFLQMTRKKSNWPMRLAVKLVTFFLVSFFAICGSLPLVTFYFNQISLVGLAANFLVVPLVGFITIPLGLLSFFISPLSTTLAAWCLKAGAVSLAGALDIVRFFADLPLAAVTTITPGLLEIICYYTLGWALLNIFRPPLVGGPQSRVTSASLLNGNNRTLEAALPANRLNLKRVLRIDTGARIKGAYSNKLPQMVAVLTLLILGADSCYWLYQRFWHSDLRVTVIDVGDGSAALLEIPGGFTIMIDGGGFSDNSSFDVGSRIIAPLLWKKKIKTVDLLVLSHPNSDHLNGLIYLADHFNVKTLWTNDEARPTQGYQQLMQVCARRGIYTPAYARMEREHLISGVQLDLLYPPQDFMDHKKSDKWRSINNNSLVVKVSYGEASFLFTGDIMAPAERELVELAGGRLVSRVLIAPHHGSRSSSSQKLLQAVEPEMIIISCSRNGRFNFPHPEILERYQDLGVRLFRTDLNGAVRLSTDGQLMRIDSVNPNPDKPVTQRKN